MAMLQRGGLAKLLAALDRALAPVRHAAAAKEGQTALPATSEATPEHGSDSISTMAAEDLLLLLGSLELLAQAQSSHPGLARDAQMGSEVRVMSRFS